MTTSPNYVMGFVSFEKGPNPFRENFYVSPISQAESGEALIMHAFRSLNKKGRDELLRFAGVVCEVLDKKEAGQRSEEPKTGEEAG